MPKHLCSLVVVLSYSIHGQAQTTKTDGDGAALKPHKIICIGDSITAGYGATQGGYPDILQEMFGPGYVVRNAGASGATLGKRNKGNLGEFAPEIIIIKLGTNDAAPANWSKCKASFADNYKAFIDDLNTLTPKPRIYLVLPVPRFDAEAAANLANEVIPIVKKVAAEKNVSVIDCHTPFLNMKQLFGDGLHPGDAGQKMLAEIFYRALTTVEQAKTTVLDDKVEQYRSTELARRIRVTAHYTTGIVDDTAVRDCRVSSLDPDVAGVSSNGTLTARAVGAVRVRLEMPGFADTVTIQVVPNRTPPGVEAVCTSQTDAQKVSVVFDEPVEKGTAETIRNYTLDNGASVTSAALAVDERTVTLATTPLTRVVAYTLTVSGVKDKAGNAVPAKTARKFKYLPLVPLLNAGFESPVVPAAWPCNGVFQAAPAKADWAFTGGQGYGGLGIDRFKDGGAPEGAQTAHLNMGGSIAQSVHFEFAGTYNVVFATASKASYGSRTTIQVFVDDAKIADFLPPLKFTVYAFRFSVSSGDHKLTFAQLEKNRPGLGFIDDVRIVPVDPDVPAGSPRSRGVSTSQPSFEGGSATGAVTAKDKDKDKDSITITTDDGSQHRCLPQGATDGTDGPDKNVLRAIAAAKISDRVEVLWWFKDGERRIYSLKPVVAVKTATSQPAPAGPRH